jgi:hypothetical protein
MKFLLKGLPFALALILAALIAGIIVRTSAAAIVNFLTGLLSK